MTRDEVIKLAQEAGFHGNYTEMDLFNAWLIEESMGASREIERLRACVAELESAVLAVREEQRQKTDEAVEAALNDFNYVGSRDHY